MCKLSSETKIHKLRKSTIDEITFVSKDLKCLLKELKIEEIYVVLKSEEISGWLRDVVTIC